MQIFLVAALVAALFLPTAANAAEEEVFYGDLHAIIHGDFGTTPHNKSVVYSHTEAEWGARLGGGFSVNNTLKLERLEHHGHGHDEQEEEPKSSFLDRHILIIEELTLNWDNEDWGFYGGKFYPTVGFIYEEFPGINAHHVVEEYAIHERIGLGAARKWQNTELEVATFFADTTFMSDAAFTNRQRLHKRDGGIANTEDFSSVAVAFRGELPDDGESILSNPIYRLGYAYQARGQARGEPADGSAESAESRYSLGGGADLRLADDWILRALLEGVWVKNFEGENNRRRIYGTASFRLKHHNWHWHAFHAGKFNRAEEREEAENDYLNELSMGYDFTDSGWSVDWGYAWLKEEGANSQMINLMLTYVGSWGKDDDDHGHGH